MRVALACGIVGLLVSSCAATRPAATPPRTIDLAPAHALADAGCYRCLLQAYDLYEQAWQSRGAPPDTARRLFATALLLALREKELGLEAARWLERARAVAAETDDVYLQAVEAVPWTSAGVSADFEVARPLSARTRDVWRARLLAVDAQSTLDTYLQVVVACAGGVAGLEPGLERRALAGPPLVRYRLGACGSARREVLEAVFAADPRFVEIPFLLAKYEMEGAFTRRDWLARALPHLEAAHQGVPESPVITVALAGAARTRRALERALGLYDRALADRPQQREALLGRVTTLSSLRRHDEAIATATRMIELGTWYVGDARYWRAWNHYQRARLDEAAADVAAARATLVNVDVLTLDGLIAYDQKRATDARASFTEARAKDPTVCVSSWYLGLLDVDASSWDGAVGAFGAAADCYRAAAAAFLKAAAQIPADTPDELQRAEAEEHARHAADSLRQAGRASLNAAQAALRLGDTVRAVQHARLAAEQPDTRARAEALLQALARTL